MLDLHWLILLSSTGIAHTIYTDIDHGLNRITKLSIVDGGSAYGSNFSGSLYNARLVGFGGSVTGDHKTAKINFDATGTITSYDYGWWY